jgi:hypothetical protein
MDLVEDQLSFSKKLMKKVMMLSNMVNKLELSQINIYSINLFIFIQLSVLLKHSQDFQGSKKFVWTQKIITIQYGKYYLLEVLAHLWSASQFKFRLNYLLSIAPQKNYCQTISLTMEINLGKNTKLALKDILLNTNLNNWQMKLWGKQ